MLTKIPPLREDIADPTFRESVYDYAARTGEPIPIAVRRPEPAPVPPAPNVEPTGWGWGYRVCQPV